jgi:hypothetical protein
MLSLQAAKAKAREEASAAKAACLGMCVGHALTHALPFLCTTFDLSVFLLSLQAAKAKEREEAKAAKAAASSQKKRARPAKKRGERHACCHPLLLCVWWLGVVTLSCYFVMCARTCQMHRHTAAAAAYQCSKLVIGECTAVDPGLLAC